MAEQQFLGGGAMFVGTIKHLGEDDRNQLTAEAMSTEALTTSEIEGEILDRASVQSSIQRQMGLAGDNRRVGPAERGASEIIAHLYKTLSAPLPEEMLSAWHRTLMSGRRDLADAGRCRTGAEPRQVLSGPMGSPRIRFEAPPSQKVASETARFIDWFNRAAPGHEQPLPALTRAGVTHLYFESIHPFEDGNGRLGRAAPKCLAQNLGQPSLIALAAAILARRAGCYDALQAANKDNAITDGLAWFARIAIEAQRRTIALIEFLIDKTNRLRGQFNDRQPKARLRMFREGSKGLPRRINCGKYGSIAGASPRRRHAA